MKLSVLNLVPLRQGQSFREAMEAAVRLGQGVEKLGYARMWLAEHHNTKSIASSATALLMEYLLMQTETIQIGSGGIMLPNHSPYLVAEEFGTLETLFPGRVDLGLGRAPGTDRQTAMAIRRTGNLYSDFEEELAELRGYFDDTNPVHAYPAAGLNVPFYILGSSTDSAWLAAKLGLPYCFASHFAPSMMVQAVTIYRTHFQPSQYLDKPYVILGCNVAAAQTDAQARRLATTQLMSFIGIITGRSNGLQPPKNTEEEVWDDLLLEVTGVPHFGPIAFQKEDLLRDVKAAIAQMGSVTLVGSPATLPAQILDLKKQVDFDELMVVSSIYDEQEQLESFKIFKEVVDKLNL